MENSRRTDMKIPFLGFPAVRCEVGRQEWAFEARVPPFKRLIVHDTDKKEDSKERKRRP
jgi:hypothetical protein